MTSTCTLKDCKSSFFLFTKRLERNSPDTLLIPVQVSPDPWVIALEVQDSETFL